MEAGRIKAQQIRATGATVAAAHCHTWMDQLMELNTVCGLGVRIKTVGEILAEAVSSPGGRTARGRAMSLITVAFQHDLAFLGTVRGHQVRMDMPGHPRFTDTGPSPVDLLAMAIGGCIGIHVAMFCHQAGFSPAGLRVDLSYTLAEADGRRRVASVYAEVEAPGVPPDRKAAVEEAGRASILPIILSGPVELEVAVRTGGAQAAA